MKNLYLVVAGTDESIGFVKASSSAGARQIAEQRFPSACRDGRFAVKYVCKDFTYESQFAGQTVSRTGDPL